MATKIRDINSNTTSSHDQVQFYYSNKVDSRSLAEKTAIKEAIQEALTNPIDNGLVHGTYERETWYMAAVKNTKSTCVDRMWDLLDRDSQKPLNCNFVAFTDNRWAVTVKHLGPYRRVKGVVNEFRQIANVIEGQLESELAVFDLEPTDDEEEEVHVDEGEEDKEEEEEEEEDDDDKKKKKRRRRKRRIRRNRRRRKMNKKQLKLALKKIRKTKKALRNAKKGLSVAKALFKAISKKAAKKTAEKAAKSAIKKIPGVGFFAGLGWGIARAWEGDWAGAGMEVASGAAGTVPGVGTAISVAIDASLIGKDMYEEYQRAQRDEKEAQDEVKRLEVRTSRVDNKKSEKYWGPLRNLWAGAELDICSLKNVCPTKFTRKIKLISPGVQKLSHY